MPFNIKKFEDEEKSFIEEIKALYPKGKKNVQVTFDIKFKLLDIPEYQAWQEKYKGEPNQIDKYMEVILDWGRITQPDEDDEKKEVPMPFDPDYMRYLLRQSWVINPIEKKFHERYAQVADVYGLIEKAMQQKEKSKEKNA